MQPFQTEFLRFVIDHEILRFGEFTLKSGRVSPYFFNAGRFDSGARLAFLARCYAQAIHASGISFDMLFGPAYKGIPLVCATAVTLAGEHGVDRPWCFNRKETKDHGEGGAIVGAEPKGRVMLIDDVITAGTAVREAATILQGKGAELCGIAVAMDRQERGTGELSAIQEIERRYHLKVVSIVTLEDVMAYMESSGDPSSQQRLQDLRAYHQRYGVRS